MQWVGAVDHDSDRGSPQLVEVVVRGLPACRAALTDHRLRSQPPSTLGLRLSEHNLLFMDGPEHDALRAAVHEHLASIDRSTFADRLHVEAGRLAQEGPQDALHDYIEPFVARAALRLLDVPPSLDEALLPPLRSTIGLLDASTSAAPDHASSAVAHMAVHLHRAASTAGRQGLQAIVLRRAATGDVPAAHVPFTVPVVLHGAYENPANLLGHALVAGPGEPGTELAPLLLSAPVRRVVRWSHEPVAELGVPANALVWVDLESAVRDAASGTLAERAAMAFGFGPHRCPGMRFARPIVDAGRRALQDAGLGTTLRIEPEPERRPITNGFRSLRIVEARPPTSGSP